MIGRAHLDIWGGSMDQEQIISIVKRAGVPFDPEVTRQAEFHFVRFFHHATQRSLNLGYYSPDGPFVADFVFKNSTREQNQADLKAFMRLFGGEVGKRETPFARLKPSFSDEVWLIRVIQAYWAMGEAARVFNR
jgi:hypothetical protein